MADIVNYVLFDFWELEGDPRISTYPFFTGGPWFTWSLIAFYAYFVKYLGPSLMKNREPFVLKYPILLYNIGMIFLNAFFFYEIVVRYRFGIDMNMWNFKKLDSNDTSPQAMRVVWLSVLFLVSKYLDLIETVFFVLRKKQNQISNLHVYHHSAVPLLVHAFAKISAAGGPGTMFPFLNCFIHIGKFSPFLLNI